MTTDDAYRLLARCLARMPARYPKPRLVVHDTPEALVSFLKKGRYAFHRGYDASDVMGIADALRGTIHLPRTTLQRESTATVLGVLLHEVGHLYAAQRYGVESDQYTDEVRANAFERRWLNRLAKELLS
jgi:hypothetical protein